MVDITLEQALAFHINAALSSIHIIANFNTTPVTCAGGKPENVTVAPKIRVVVAGEVDRQFRRALN